MQRSTSRMPVLDKDHVLGSEGAPVTLITYCDFECPYCRRAAPIIASLRRQLGERLQFVFRHFPLSKHPMAQPAAEAAEAAGAQGQFWAMHDLLLDHPGTLTEEAFYAYADDLGLDLRRFADDLREHRYAPRVQRDVEHGRLNGVTGTPTFFVNGQRHNEEQTLEALVRRTLEGNRL
jgi:protein-disulfide isomerase